MFSDVMLWLSFPSEWPSQPLTVVWQLGRQVGLCVLTPPRGTHIPQRNPCCEGAGVSTLQGPSHPETAHLYRLPSKPDNSCFLKCDEK